MDADTTPSTGHADELQVFVLQLTSFSSGDEILSQSDGESIPSIIRL